MQGFQDDGEINQNLLDAPLTDFFFEQNGEIAQQFHENLNTVLSDSDEEECQFWFRTEIEEESEGDGSFKSEIEDSLLHTDTNVGIDGIRELFADQDHGSALPSLPQHEKTEPLLLLPPIHSDFNSQINHSDTHFLEGFGEGDMGKGVRDEGVQSGLKSIAETEDTHFANSKEAEEEVVQETQCLAELGLRKSEQTMVHERVTWSLKIGRSELTTGLRLTKRGNLSCPTEDFFMKSQRSGGLQENISYKKSNQ